MKVEFAGLETFESPFNQSSSVVHITMPEFTCLCPKTGQPDFGKLELQYLPKQRCVELKSLKLYLWTFRERGVFHEAVAEEITNELDRVIEPWWMRFTARFYVRGGLYTTVTIERGHSDAIRQAIGYPQTARDASENYR